MGNKARSKLARRCEALLGRLSHGLHHHSVQLGLYLGMKSEGDGGRMPTDRSINCSCVGAHQSGLATFDVREEGTSGPGSPREPTPEGIDVGPPNSTGPLPSCLGRV